MSLPSFVLLRRRTRLASVAHPCVRICVAVFVFVCVYNFVSAAETVADMLPSPANGNAIGIGTVSGNCDWDWEWDWEWD